MCSERRDRCASRDLDRLSMGADPIVASFGLALWEVRCCLPIGQILDWPLVRERRERFRIVDVVCQPEEAGALQAVCILRRVWPGVHWLTPRQLAFASSADGWVCAVCLSL